MKYSKRDLVVLSLLIIFCGALLNCCKREKVVSLRSLLIEMTDRESLTRFPVPFYNLKQFSSYDRRSDLEGLSNWFANSDYTHFTGVDSSAGRKEYILFDAEGPGAVVRWWMTFAGEGSSDGILRIYIDGNNEPVIEENVLKLLSGHLLAGPPLSTSVSPESEPHQRGHNLYLPIPYKKQCRITYECDAIVITPESRKPSIYYNICYRQYEKGTRVVSFSLNELAHASELITGTNGLLEAPELTTGRVNKKHSLSLSIQPNDSVQLVISDKRSAISRIILKLEAENRPQALQSTVISISFDDHRTIWVPAGHFFGTAYRETTSSTFFSSVDNELKMESYWLMPFRKNCIIRLINFGGEEVKADLEAETAYYKWDRNSMYFGASWHEYHQIEAAGSELTGGTGLHRDISFADIAGQGVYAGDAITVLNSVDAWWGEGDEKIYVDGESFPSSFGTGTEDYYGYAWCRPEVFTHPFIAQPDGSGNFHPGTSVNMRYRSLDAIPFRTRISSNIELWHWLPAVINYSLTTYWYTIPPFTISIKPDPESVKRPVPADPSSPKNML